MSDELNNDIEQEVQESVESETTQEIETVEGQETEIPTPEPEAVETPKPKPAEKRISTLVSKLSHKDQELAQVRAEVETLRALQPAQEPAKAIDLPDDDLRYDDPQAYKEQLNAYYKNVAAQEFKEQQRIASEATKQAEVKEQQAKLQQRHQEIVSTYVDNGLKLGVSEEKMLANEQVLAAAGLDTGLIQEMYADEVGAKLVDLVVDEYIDELAGLNPYQAAVKLATVIKPKALSKKPTHSTAPDPVQPTRGVGTVPSEGVNPIIKGATFA